MKHALGFCSDLFPLRTAPRTSCIIMSRFVIALLSPRLHRDVDDRVEAKVLPIREGWIRDPSVVSHTSRYVLIDLLLEAEGRQKGGGI